MGFYCDNCGNELLPKSEFCNKCGTKVSGDPWMAPSTSQREGGYNMMGFHMSMPQMMILGAFFFVLMILMMITMATLFGPSFNFR